MRMAMLSVTSWVTIMLLLSTMHSKASYNVYCVIMYLVYIVKVQLISLYGIVIQGALVMSPV